MRRGDLCTARLRDGLEEITFMASPQQAEELEALWGYKACLLVETITTGAEARRRLISIEGYHG